MLFALLLLLTPLPQAAPGDTPASPTADQPVVAAHVSSERASAVAENAVAGAPAREAAIKEVPSKAAGASFLPGQLVLQPIVHASAEAAGEQRIEPRPGDVAALPEPPVLRRRLESPAQRRMWYALTIAGHGAASFDAWSTRRAISRGYGQEANPLLRPFANSGALYVAVQASPVVMDYLARRMMNSRHPWVRRMCWLPQSAGTAVSLGSGVHNTLVGP